IGSGSGTAAGFSPQEKFNIKAPPHFVKDWVVVPMSPAREPGAGTPASPNGSGSAGSRVRRVPVPKGADGPPPTRGVSDNTGVFLKTDPNPPTQAINIAAAINRNGGAVGVASTASGATVTVTATRVGPQGNNIAVSKTAGLTLFAWSGGTLTGGSG